MKGSDTSEPTRLFVLVVLTLIIICIITSSIYQLYKKNELYDRMANPLVFTAGEVVKYGTEKFVKTCENFLDEVESIFVYDELERECSGWFSNCAETVENPPQNPWTKLELSEKDLETMEYLNFECRTSGIDKIKVDWADKSPNFAKKEEFEQYHLIRNACGSILVSKIYK